MNKLRIVLVLLGLGLVMPAMAQKKAPKTGKKKSKNEKSIYDYVDSASVPEKYKNESVVILGHYEKSKVIMPKEPFKIPNGESKVSPNYMMNAFNITRYLLQDKNALEKFSTYYFTESEFSKRSIVIIKKSGERIEVDMTKAISSEDQANLKIERLAVTVNFGKYKKIALPGLEVGDMIEYSAEQFYTLVDVSDIKSKSSSDNLDRYSNAAQSYSYNSSSGGSAGSSVVGIIISLVYFYPHLFATKHPTQLKKNGVEVPEYTIYLNKTYPVLKQVYEVTTSSKVLPIEYSSANGAPTAKITNKEDEQVFKLESEMNDPVTAEYYFMMANNIPTVRYTFDFVKYRKHNMHFSASGKGLDKEAASELAAKMVKGKWKGNAISTFFDIETSIGKKLNKMDDMERTKYLYYYYKKHYGLSTFLLSEGEKLGSQTSFQAAKLFQIYCDRYAIPYEVIMYSPRQAGSTRYAVSGDNLAWGILAKIGSEDVYLTDFDAYSEFNVPSRYMYGAEVFYVSPKDDYAARSAVFNNSNPNKHNKLVLKTTAKINENHRDLTMKSTFSAGGEIKTEYYKMVCTYSDFYKAYETMMGDEKTAKKKKGDDEDEINLMRIHFYSDDFRELEKQEEEKERLRKSSEKASESAKKETYEAFIVNEYDKKAEVTKVKTEETGISTMKSKDPEVMEFVVEHKLENTVKDLDANSMVVDLGRLITSQVEFKDLEDRKRKYDIDVNYHKSYNTVIELEVPAGYKALNLDDFKFNKDNELMSFVATVKQDGNKIIFESTKTYKSVHGNAADWNKMVEVMDAAAHVYQRKLLLEK